MKCLTGFCTVVGVAVLLTAPAATMGQCISACCEGSTCTQIENQEEPCCSEACCEQCSGNHCVSGVCTSPAACCVNCPGPSCTCKVLDPICCIARGGTVQVGTCPFNCVMEMARDDDDGAVSSNADASPTEPAEDCDEDSPQPAEPVSKKSDESTLSGFGILITALLFTALVPMLVGLRRFMLRRPLS